ncbi:MAG: hypothetical protein GY859_24590 [Desulfobacterales bacterium]|nr:hypothetical protein [Desulfobacterales bacterium]
MAPFRKPRRVFEKSGVVDPARAFYVPLENVTNLDNQDIQTMVDLGRYFSIFAPRQSGKTTFFEGVCEQLETDPEYIPIILSFQDYKDLDKSRFYQLVQKYLYRGLITRLEAIKCPVKDTRTFLDSHPLTDHISIRELFEELNQRIQSKKIVIFIDEFDGIPEGELENFLTALRQLYQQYKKKTEKALYSVGLIGIRNITKLTVGGVSPFNIADQVKLPSFSLENIRDLYGQYTAETNQPFEEGAIREVHEATAGQPWLVNRIGTSLTMVVKPGTTAPITAEDARKAIDMLLYEENDHFENITRKAEKYKEAFVDVVFNGVELIPGNKVQSLLLTHGLVKARGKDLYVGNPIYKKRFTKTFFTEISDNVDVSASRYYSPNGGLNMKRILADFEKYIAQIGAAAFYSTKNPMEVTGKFQLTAWLYQFVGGENDSLHHESRAGLGIMDIMLIHGRSKYIIETKINRYSGTIEDALEQLTEKYLLPERVDHGYIVLFDPKTTVGELCKPRVHKVKDKEVLSFNIGIGKPVGFRL